MTWMTWMTWIVLGVGVLLVAVVVLVLVGTARWASATKVQMALLDAASVPMPAGRFNAREIEGLPAPVQRYFRAVLKDGQPFIASASFDFAGTFNMSTTGEQ